MKGWLSNRLFSAKKDLFVLPDFMVTAGEAKKKTMIIPRLNTLLKAVKARSKQLRYVRKQTP